MTTTALQEKFMADNSELMIGEAQVVDITAEVTFQSYYDQSARKFDSLFNAEPKLDDTTLEGVIAYQDFLTALLHSLENNGEHPLPSLTPDIDESHQVTEGLISEFLGNIPWCLPPRKLADDHGYSLTTYDFKLSPYDNRFARINRVEHDYTDTRTIYYSVTLPVRP